MITVAPLMKLSKNKLQTFRGQLQKQHDEIIVKLKELTQSTDPTTEESQGDLADQANADASSAFRIKIQKHARTLFAEIDIALRRIEAGTFGECSECGESISEARILASPATTLCIDCKAGLESEKSRFLKK